MSFLRRVRTNNRIKEFWMLSATLGGGAMVYRNGEGNYTRYKNLKCLMDKCEAAKQRVLKIPEDKMESSLRQEMMKELARVEGLLVPEMAKYKWTSKFFELMNYKLTAKFTTRLPKT